jgi:iron complex outermembrane receptor protein
MKKLSLVQAGCLQAASLLACTTAISIAQAQSAQQQSPASTPEIIVTASRSEQLLQTAPVGATIITRAQIESAGVTDANEAIRKVGGVAGKTDLSGGREHQLDLRGFGATSQNNTVVLVDGIRISENEQAAARLSGIPASTIERIEIVRGGSSVMWGEGASGGVINVILRSDTKKGVTGSVAAGVETYYKDGSAALRVGSASGKGAFDLQVNSNSGAGFRQNNKSNQDVIDMGVSAKEGDISLRARAHHERFHSALPNSLSLTNFLIDPKKSTATAKDYYNYSDSRYSTGLDYRMGSWTAVVDLGIKSRSTEFGPGTGTAVSQTNTDSTQFSPRAVYKDSFGSSAVNANIGLDIINWSYKTKSSFSNRVGNQTNRAFFAATDWLFATDTRIIAGMRTESVLRTASNLNNTTTYYLNNKVRASELALNQSIKKGLDVYVRAANSFRVANIDEYTSTNNAIELRPQTSKDTELGVKWRDGTSNLTARYFVQNTINEIYYDPTNFVNINYDPTKRKGIELQGGVNVSNKVYLSGSLQAMSAIFVSGTHAGKHIPLVSEQTAVLRAQYRLDDKQSIDSALRVLSGAYYGGDEANTSVNKIPSNRFIDAQYRFIDKGLELSFGFTNLMNRVSYSNGFTPATPTVYPDPGRVVRAGLKYNF